MLANAGAALGDVGLLEQSENQLKAVLNTAERMQLGALRGFVLMSLCSLRAQLGHFEQARAAGAEALAMARTQGDPRTEGITRIYLSIADCMEERFIEAETHARLAVALLNEVPPALPGALAALALALLQQGRDSEALTQAREAYRVLEEVGRVDDGEALIRLVYGRCLIVSGRDQEGHWVIRHAARRLEERAAAIDDPVWREAFLTRLSFHAETLSLARSSEGGASPDSTRRSPRVG
jgi:tetratricopeptide (TPR) repeat protein